MKLIELLSPDRIVIPVTGTFVREAARPLAGAIAASVKGADLEKLEALLAETLPREAVTSGQHGFLLHLRTDAVPSLTAALGVAEQPVRRELYPGREGRIVVMVAAPPGETLPYVRAVSGFARMLANDEVAEAVLAAGGPDDVLAIKALKDAELPEDLLVRDVIPHQVLSVKPDTTLQRAAALMVRHSVPALPVVGDDNEVLGMVSHGELMRYLLPAYTKRMSGEFPAAKRPRGKAAKEAKPPDDPRNMPVRDAMDRSVLCIPEDERLADAAAVMMNKNVDRVPVVREGSLVGLLTREDIVRRLFGT